MALSYDNVIHAEDILTIAELKPLKVYLLIGHSKDKLVIKSDAVTEAHVKSANTAVKAIDPSAKAKALNIPETDAIKEWIATWEGFTVESGQKSDDKEKAAVASLKTSLGWGLAWFKMTALDVTDLEKALIKRLNGDKSEIKIFIAALTAKGGLEKFGQMIAADLFNGNNDRFLPADKTDDRSKTIGPMTFKFRCLINIKNVFVATSKAGYEISALDHVDPNSGFKDITATLVGKQWPAELLLSKKERAAFAADVIHDMELVLNPHKSKYSLLSKLGKDAPSRVVAGMVAGAAAIKARLEKKYKDTMAGGVKERYDIISQVK